ncbi:carbon-nitrogen hydrolase family protein [uncultured Salinisphaera sp.]|uniref:carbon-nitrogen hydrolase family protein n=1 Tax=uncultured Salinisphaera sp. TaxID=359372 RepID=UPI0032B12293
MTADSNLPHVAAIQMNSRGEVAPNLACADDLLADAARRGAQLAVLPENFALMGAHETDKIGVAEADGAGNGHTPIQDFLAEAARKYGLWIVGGTIPLASDEPDRVYPSCPVYADNGERVARYDKIHLFDVGVPDSAEAYRESATFVAGPPTPHVVDTPIGRLGLSVCYDLRFPELYRAMAAEGAEIVVAPSAFTHTTGSAHWHVLTRARAIENLVTMIAPNQAGHHANGRRTYGHSLIIDPWGQIKAEAQSEANEVIVAPIDRARIASLREGFPCLSHRRLF